MPQTPNISYEAYRGTSFFSSLDGLRCLSILGVIWFHVGPKINGLNFLQHGNFGVDLFFAISGFLITTLLLREQDRWGSISLRAFYIRRGLRIFPLYYTVLALYVVLTWLLERNSEIGRQFFVHLPAYLTYTSNWFVAEDKRVIFYFAWSLATEEQFYLFWPSIEKFFRGWRAVALIIGVLILREIVGAAAQAGYLHNHHLLAAIILSIHPAILGGAILAHALHDRRTFSIISPLLGGRWATPIIFASLVAAIQFEVSMDAIWTLMILLVGSVAINESNFLSPLLKWRPVAHIGTVSYGIYLMHMLCYHAVLEVVQSTTLDNPWIKFCLTALLATFVATISYRYYESWFLRLKSRFARIKTHHPVEEGPVVAYESAGK